MSWQTEWNALANRIKGLIDAGHLLFLSIRDRSTQNTVTMNRILIPHAEEIHEDILKFKEIYESNISAASIECIDRFLSDYKDLCYGERNALDKVQNALTLLASFCSEFSYHLSDMEAISQRLTERAFVHLKRSIVADPTVKDRWNEAFDKGEIYCEKLGAAHLLLHGIWAFKASSEGERTDLILGEPLRDLSEVEATAEALVLTEWKVVGNPKAELKKKTDQAFKQAKRYAGGILAGFELTSYRYLVVVSKNILDIPPDVFENGINYRYINIAVDPSPPSRS